MRVYPELRGNNIIIRYLPVCLSVAHMALEHYDTEAYKDTVLLVNTEDTYEEAKQLYPNKRLVYYQQEHLRMPTDWRLYCLARITKFDEIWDIDWNNISFYNASHRAKVKFRPMRYTTYYEDKKIITKENPSFDILFCGTLVGKRLDIFSHMSYKFEFNKTMIVWGKKIEEIRDLLSDCKFCLNLHQHDITISNQEQIRIFELLMLGKSVIAEESTINYFGDLITETRADNILNVLNIADFSDKSERYKKMTYEDKDYDKYCQDIMFKNIQVGRPLNY